MEKMLLKFIDEAYYTLNNTILTREEELKIAKKIVIFENDLYFFRTINQ